MSSKVNISNLKLESVLVLLMTTVSFISANRCTDVLSKNEVHEVTYKEPCLEKYTARCGWLSLSYCTFYQTIFCDKKRNEIVQVYYVVSGCCTGYIMSENGTCMKKSPGVEHEAGNALPIAANPGHLELPVKPKKDIPVENLEITGGGYAGIACGVVLIACVATFTALGIRKRRLKKRHPKQIQSAQLLPMCANIEKSTVICTASYMRTPMLPQSQEVGLCTLSRTLSLSQIPVKSSVETPLVSPDNMVAGNRDLSECDV